MFFTITSLIAGACYRTGTGFTKVKIICGLIDAIVFRSRLIVNRLNCRELKTRVQTSLYEAVVERSFPTPEICGSNPVVGPFNLLSTLMKRRK